MTATNHTEHYGLSQYTESDHPTYIGDYNGDMSKIDAAIYAASQSGGGITTVEHTADLTGDGTTGSPLGVADTIARTAALSAYATTESVSQMVNTAVADRPTTSQVAQSIADAIADRLTALNIKAGNAIDVSAVGNDVTISYVGGTGSGGIATVAHDYTLTGDGTIANPLGIISGTAVNERILTGVTVDFNDYVESGFYGCNSVSLLNAPNLGDVTRFSFLVLNCGYVGESRKTCCIQVVFNRGFTKTEMYMRTLQYSSNWGSWVKFITDSTYNALADRVTALEQALSQSAPSTTGLTAKQLDSQYSDGYNIVRVGTPTPQDETEESS